MQAESRNVSIYAKEAAQKSDHDDELIVTALAKFFIIFTYELSAPGVRREKQYHRERSDQPGKKEYVFSINPPLPFPFTVFCQAVSPNTPLKPSVPRDHLGEPPDLIKSLLLCSQIPGLIRRVELSRKGRQAYFPAVTF